MLQSKRLTQILFVVYLILLIWIILFKLEFSFSNMGTMQSVNFTPYAAPTRFNGEVVRSEMFLNVLIFMPFGIYLEALNKSTHFILKLGTIFLASLTFELLQYFLAMGASDVTDIIHNVLGGIIGLLLYTAISQRGKADERNRRWLNGVAAVVTAVVVLGLVVFKII